MLCRFGGRPEAERAKQVGIFIENWLEKQKAVNQHPPDSDGQSVVEGAPGANSEVSPRGIAAAYRAIGMSQSHWARLTFDASSRAEIQANAVKNLRMSLAPEYEDTDSHESLFALGLLLAETRDITGAIEVVKRALLPSTNSVKPTTSHSNTLDENYPNRSEGQFTKERSLIPFWHLLALLLSARQDFATAVKSCEASFEQFLDPVNLFGRDDPNVASPGDRWLAFDENFGRTRARGIVDDMEIFEREGILQVKMTQLALVEVLEGPEIAVNASDELLSLYQRLFRDQKIAGPRAPVTPPQPPKSSSGTIRSFGGGLFSRQRSLRKNILAETNPYSTLTLGTTSTSRPQTMASQAPKIQITDEDGGTKGKGHHNRQHESALPTHVGEKLHKRHKSLSSLRKKRIEKQESKPKNDIPEKQSSRDRKDNEQSHVLDFEQPDLHPNSYRGAEGRISPSPSQVGLAVSPDIPSPAPSITTEDSPQQSTQHGDYRTRSLEPTDSSRRPNQNFHLPGIRFLPHRCPILRRDDRRRRSVKVLIKVWLLIAGLYRRASMYDDAREAVDEATKLVDGLEIEISKDASSSRAFGDPGWEGGKSVEELRGDVLAEAGVCTSRCEMAYTDNPYSKATSP
jgi:cargo-transport protein YPP1